MQTIVESSAIKVQANNFEGVVFFFKSCSGFTMTKTGLTPHGNAFQREIKIGNTATAVFKTGDYTYTIGPLDDPWL